MSLNSSKFTKMVSYVFRMAVKHFPDLCNASLSLATGVVYVTLKWKVIRRLPILDQLVIGSLARGGGNCHQCLGKGPYPGATKGNILHGAFNTGREDPVTN